jgi:hypothetical protein
MVSRAKKEYSLNKSEAEAGAQPAEFETVSISKN